MKPMSAAMTEQNGRLQWRIGKRVKPNQTILLLDEDFLFSSEATN